MSVKGLEKLTNNATAHTLQEELKRRTTQFAPRETGLQDLLTQQTAGCNFPADEPASHCQGMSCGCQT